MQWLRNRLKELGKKPIDLARHLGIAPARVYEMQTGKRQVQPSEIGPLARFLEMPEAAVVAYLEGRDPPRSTPTDVDQISRAGRVVTGLKPPASADMPRDVPVLGTVSGGPGGFQMANGDATDWVRRPPRVEGRADVFALFVEDVSMSPAFKPGALIFVERNRPPQIGDDVVVELHPQSQGDEPRAILKELVAITPTLLRLRQHKPEKTLEIPRSRVIRISRVMTNLDLYGF